MVHYMRRRFLTLLYIKRKFFYLTANKPPSISCSQPELATITAKPLQTSVVVTWAYPTTSDPEGDSVRYILFEKISKY